MLMMMITKLGTYILFFFVHICTEHEMSEQLNIE